MLTVPIQKEIKTFDFGENVRYLKTIFFEKLGLLFYEMLQILNNNL